MSGRTRAHATSQGGLLIGVAVTFAVLCGCSSSATSTPSLRSIEVPREVTGAVAISPDGSKVLTVGEGGAMVWDGSTGAQLLDLRGKFTATSLDVGGAFDATGARFVTPSNEHGAMVWDAKTGAQLMTVAGAPVYSASFTADGTKILTVGSTGAALWDATTGAQLVAFGAGSSGVFGSTDRDGSKVVTMGQTVTVWDGHSGSELSTVGPAGLRANAGALAPDGSRVATAGLLATRAAVWDLASGSAAIDLEGARAAAFSPDGSELATVGVGRAVVVRDASTGKVLTTLTAPAGSFGSVAFAGHGGRLVVGTTSGATIWDVSQLHH